MKTPSSTLTDIMPDIVEYATYFPVLRQTAIQHAKIIYHPLAYQAFEVTTHMTPASPAQEPTPARPRAPSPDTNRYRLLDTYPSNSDDEPSTSPTPSPASSVAERATAWLVGFTSHEAGKGEVVYLVRFKGDSRVAALGKMVAWLGEECQRIVAALATKTEEVDDSDSSDERLKSQASNPTRSSTAPASPEHKAPTDATKPAEDTALAMKTKEVDDSDSSDERLKSQASTPPRSPTAPASPEHEAPTDATESAKEEAEKESPNSASKENVKSTAFL